MHVLILFFNQFKNGFDWKFGISDVFWLRFGFGIIVEILKKNDVLLIFIKILTII